MPAQRYLLGGENLSMREVFAAIATPRSDAARRARGAVERRLRRRLGRRTPRSEPRLLVLDEVRVARWPMLFDDSPARRELGYSSRPAAEALAAAARRT